VSNLMNSSPVADCSTVNSRRCTTHGGSGVNKLSARRAQRHTDRRRG
jgi:hypothetical protein